ncbi:hypothetical protein Ahy_B02g060255 [Arachis hypogaea]|uniref:Aminotransferase-like plant mobile domain-containing protein n=1 Tax=Arachis hypogaea TaxID=3818 RepID=A0A445AI34_ARAHY|nr:hypothetical protein Ahy_B02g060255 [Arachis hypogaea]
MAACGASPQCQAFGGSTTSRAKKRVVHTEACLVAGPCPPDAPTDDPETLWQYARCYIMLLIGGYLLTDKLNNLVHLRWLPLLEDFGRCRALSWGSAIYQRFPQWCPVDRRNYQYPMAVRLVRLQQQSRNQHEARVLRWWVSINRLRFDEALCHPWFFKKEEWGTWMSVFPLIYFNIVLFH